jgi:translation elongation factor EF-G
MAKYSTESIRAVALVGHGGAGKTTLAEALLFKAGAIAAKGSRGKGQHRLRLRRAGEESPAIRCIPRW